MINIELDSNVLVKFICQSIINACLKCEYTNMSQPSLAFFCWLVGILNAKWTHNLNANLLNRTFWTLIKGYTPKTSASLKTCMTLFQPSPQAFSARSILDSTMSCDVTGRYSPTLSQTSRGQRVKRERLGTRLTLLVNLLLYHRMSCLLYEVFFTL